MKTEKPVSALIDFLQQSQGAGVKVEVHLADWKSSAFDLREPKVCKLIWVSQSSAKKENFSLIFHAFKMN